jgi:dethiobiotin synthase
MTRGLKGVFVTGTGTGVGKSLVAAGLLRCLRGQGVDAVPMKPIQTGCESVAGESKGATAGATAADTAAGATAGELVAPDLEFALAVAGLRPDAAERELMCPCRYRPACSPHLAGRLAGAYADFDRIEQCARELADRHEALVVEGAGGLLAPIDERRTMRDLIARLGLPTVVVARADLGTINHALMTIECLRAAGLEPLGVILNQPEPLAAPPDGSVEAMIRRENPRAIERLGKTAILGEIGWLGGGDNAGVTADFDWGAFARGLIGLDRVLNALRSPS